VPPVRVCLDEVTENVIHHAEADHGFGAAQGWRKTHEFEAHCWYGQAMVPYTLDRPTRLGRKRSTCPARSLHCAHAPTVR
jgi:hypothetical protein